MRDVLWFHRPQFMYGPYSTMICFPSSEPGITRFNSLNELDVHIVNDICDNNVCLCQLVCIALPYGL